MGCIGNSFYGALETKDRVDAALEDLLDQYREGGDETVQFESEISYEPGLYLTESIVSEDSIIKLITSKKSVAAYYTVVDGDSPYGILDKLEMSEEEVALLNPGFSMDSSLFIGDKILINQEEPFLAVSVTRTETYDERTPYDTTYTEDSTHYEGTSTIVQEGVKGTERVTGQRFPIMNRQSAPQGHRESNYRGAYDRDNLHGHKGKACGSHR